MMPTRLDIARIDNVGNEVTADHFGGNLVYTRNNDETGGGDTHFWQGVQALGVTNIRYPGGTVAETEIDILSMPNGELDPRLVAFMEQLNNGFTLEDGSPRKTILVLRSCVMDGETTAEWAQKIQQFTEAVMAEYGHLISAFQIGNEYWSQQGAQLDEAIYGERANLAAKALQRGIDSADTDYDPNIVVQMANPATARSLFSRDHVFEMLAKPFDELSAIEQEFLTSAAAKRNVSVSDLTGHGLWDDRVEYANHTILNQLDAEAVAAIDAVVEHYYVNQDLGSDAFDFADSNRINPFRTNGIEQKFDMWERELDKDLRLLVTEWGPSLVKESNHGIREASVTLEQFELLLKLGVDEAYAWPVVHNTEVSLGARLGKTTRVDQMGVVTENHRGAVFDLMASSLVGLRQMDITHLNSSEPFELNAFGSDERMVIYIASRVEEIRDIQFDLSRSGLEYTTVSAVKVGYGQIYGEGVKPSDIYSPRWSNEIEYKVIDGKTYFFTDDNMTAELSYYQEANLIQAGRTAEVTLAPFEVVQLEYHLLNGERIDGTGEGDVLTGTARNDVLMGYAGDDVLVGGAGADRLNGGAGQDMVDYAGSNVDTTVNLSWALANSGAAQNDQLIQIEDVRVGSGNDLLVGNREDNHLYGQAGDDRLIGLDGEDHLFGGAGKDILIGHRDNDDLFGGDGDDKLFGDPGDDVLEGGRGDDVLTGGRGADVFVFRAESGRDSIVDFVSGVDRIELVGVDPAALDVTTLPNQDVVLSFGNGDTLTLVGVEGFSFEQDVTFL